MSFRITLAVSLALTTLTGHEAWPQKLTEQKQAKRNDLHGDPLPEFHFPN